MGRGPEHFLERGVERTLREWAGQVEVETVEAEEGFHTEIGTSFGLYRLLAARVRAAVTHHRFPLVLAGNCGSSLGTLAGLNPVQEPVGIVWFDAHGDFNTPETTVSGFLDGMGLAMATGHCWRGLSATIPGFVPVPDRNVVHAGARDLDPSERELFQHSEITVVDAARIRQMGLRQAFEPALAALQAEVRRVYVHLDLDVLDTSEARANEFAPPGGLTVDEAYRAIRMIGERFTISAAAITAYDPGCDDDERALHAGFTLMEAIISDAG